MRLIKSSRWPGREKFSVNLDDTGVLDAMHLRELHQFTRSDINLSSRTDSFFFEKDNYMTKILS